MAEQSVNRGDRTIKRHMRLFVAIAAVAVLGGVAMAGRAVLAASGHSSTVAGSGTALALSGFAKETLVASYTEAGLVDTPEAAGTLVAVDPAHFINCPAPAGHTCKIEIEPWIQVSSSSTSGGNLWLIEPRVDSAPTTIGGPYVGEVPTDGSYVGGSFADYKAVGPGSHKVLTAVYSINGLTVWNAAITYNVYEP